MKTFTAVVVLFLAAHAAHAAAHAAAHPLDPLTAEEQTAAQEIAASYFAAAIGLPAEALLFPYVALHEPAKALVLNGSPVPREATVHVFHAPGNHLWIVTVDLDASSVARLELAPDGTQPAVAEEEYVTADELVRAYEPWAAAMRARGVEPDDVYIDVWAPGDRELPAEVVASMPHGPRTRLLRAISFLRGASVDDYDPENPQNPYVRPVEGVVVTIDMNAHEVVHMTDTLVRPVSRESGNADTRRSGLKPRKILQPEGGGFEVSGRLVKWQNWQFHIARHPREGLVLYDIQYNDKGTLRRVAYRLSLSEIYVPYGLADENWEWRSAFDVGEYNLGNYAQTLEVNRDVPEHTYSFDDGTIGLYEKDNGILWTRTDPSNAERETRGRRDLVATWNAWIGNYIYGFDWIFGMDGTIEVRAVLTGTTLNRGEADGSVSAPNHQHFFNFRLDFDTDGVLNEVNEVDIQHIPTANFKNAFGARETTLVTETARDADPFKARHWEVGSYAIETRDFAFPYSAPDYAPLQRAAFASHAFWITRYKDDEKYAAGDFPNQGVAGAGLTSFVSPPETLDGDVVAWLTIGLTHVPRPEDMPVMPTETIGFKLVPHGFFDRNPALDAQELPEARPRRRPR